MQLELFLENLHQSVLDVLMLRCLTELQSNTTVHQHHLIKWQGYLYLKLDLLVIQPYDKTTLGDIEKAIMKSDIGITPSNDGTIIRLAVPALTEERRKEIVKTVKKEAEESKVAIRNVRRDANEEFKKLEKNAEITEDDLHRNGDEIQKLTDSYIEKIDDLAKEKEDEIMEI